MNKLILTLAAVSTLTAGAAAAQPGFGNDHDRGQDRGRGGWEDNNRGRDFDRPPFAVTGAAIDAKQLMLSRRIEVAARNGTLNRREAERLRTEMRNIERIENQFRRTRPGLTGVEIAQLDQRLDTVSMQFRFERNDRQYGYGYGYGYGR